MSPVDYDEVLRAAGWTTSADGHWHVPGAAVSPRPWAEGGDVTARWCEGTWSIYLDEREGWTEILRGPREAELEFLREFYAPRRIVDVTEGAPTEQWWTAVAVGVDAEVRCAHHHGTKAAAWGCAESMRMRGCHRGAWLDVRVVYGVERVP